MRTSRSMLLFPTGLLSLQFLLFDSSLAQQLAEVELEAEIERAEPAALVPPAQDLIADAARTQALAGRDSALRLIAELETREGSWGAELGEAWLGLGTALRALGQHEEAAEAFSNALQSLRIGYGLNDVRQLPVLQELRSTHEQMRNWEELHAANYLIFHIAKQSPDQNMRIDALLDLGRWIRKASAENLVTDYDANPNRLMDLYSNEIKRLEELEDDYAGKYLHLASLNLDLASTELMEAKRKYEMPISEFQSPSNGEQRTYMTQNCVSGVDRSGRPVQACTAPMEVPNLNYYLGPNVQKSTEIRGHLAQVENRVLAAYQMLQDDSLPGDTRNALMNEVQRLTTEYNAFIETNRNESTPLR